MAATAEKARQRYLTQQRCLVMAHCWCPHEGLGESVWAATLVPRRFEYWCSALARASEWIARQKHVLLGRHGGLFVGGIADRHMPHAHEWHPWGYSDYVRALLHQPHTTRHRQRGNKTAAPAQNV